MIFLPQILPSYLQLHIGAVRGHDLLAEELGRPEDHQHLRWERPELAGVVGRSLRPRADPETRRELDRLGCSGKLLRRRESKNHLGSYFFLALGCEDPCITIIWQRIAQLVVILDHSIHSLRKFVCSEKLSVCVHNIPNLISNLAYNTLSCRLVPLFDDSDFRRVCLHRHIFLALGCLGSLVLSVVKET